MQNARQIMGATAVAVAIGVVATALGACSSSGASDAATLSLGSPSANEYTVNVSVGGGTAVPLQVDTGSTGIRIFQQDVGGSAPTAGKATQSKFGDGTEYDGFVAPAPVAIDGIAAQANVPVQVITSVSCGAGGTGQSCDPTADAVIKNQGVHGLFGIGLQPDDAMMPNPLAYLSGFGQYTLNLPDSQIQAGIVGSPTATYQLSPSTQPGPDLPNGLGSWNDVVSACWSFQSNTPQCVSTLFDSGTASMQVDSQLPGAPNIANGSISNGAATLYYFGPQSSSSLWSLKAGDDALHAMSLVNPPAGGPDMIAGVPFMSQYSVGYDLTGGVVSVISQS